MPAKGLRTAAQTAPSFEAALAAASGHSSDELLVGAPKVLALSIVWESPQVPPPVLEATFSALRTDLDASKLFAGQDDALPYRLRCVVCYSSAHYCVFALSEEVGRWLLLNDAEVTVVGGWVDVGNAVRSRRLQPSLLFYEATPVQEE